MAEERIYYSEADFGCGLLTATSLESARRQALSEIGSHSFRGVRRATQEDVDWVRAMGGWVPQGKVDA